MIVKERFFVTFFLKKQKTGKWLRFFHSFDCLEKNKKLPPITRELLFGYLLLFPLLCDKMYSNVYSIFL